MIENFRMRLKDKQELSVVYLGGSITEGAGASTNENCWQALLSKWLEIRYPSAEIKSHNAGIGGTNSELGVFRMEKDVLIHNPDLLFVEFAVNDYGRDEKDIMETMEGIVRKARKYNPRIDIIFVHTLMMKMSQEFYGKGKLPVSIIAQEKVAAYYQIPVCNVGKKLLEVIMENKCSPEEYLPDLVHPNDKGYMVYYLELKKYIEQLLKEENKSSYVLPAPMTSNKYEDCKMIPAVSINSDFRVEKISLAGRYADYISSNRPGDLVSIEFMGTGIGCLWMIAKDSGMISYSLDNTEWMEKSSWDNYALRFNRANHCMLVKEKERGVHKLTIKVSNQKEKDSEGTFIRIGAFLIVP